MAGVPPSPYTLGSNDSPGTILTHVVLKGPNYEEWARGLRTSLRAKRKLGFVDGTITQPAADSTDLEEWWTVNSMVVAWIFNTIESNLRTTISYHDLAKDLWDDIQQRFSVGNGPRIYQLTANIVECKQQHNESIMSYFGRIKKLWDDLNDYDILPACTCKGCTCNLTGELQKCREAERVREFLMGLDVSYATVRSNLLSTEPLPNMNHVYSKLIQEEEVKNSTSTIKDDPMSFAVRAPMTSVLSSGGVSSGGARKDAQLVCTHCKIKVMRLVHVSLLLDTQNGGDHAHVSVLGLDVVVEGLDSRVRRVQDVDEKPLSVQTWRKGLLCQQIREHLGMVIEQP